MTMNDLINASLSSLFDYANSEVWPECGKNECPDFTWELPSLFFPSPDCWENFDFTEISDGSGFWDDYLELFVLIGYWGADRVIDYWSIDYLCWDELPKILIVLILLEVSIVPWT